MNFELWIQVLCAAIPAILTIGLTIYLAHRDNKHDKRIDKMAEEQRQIENRRHQDVTNAAARAFIHKHHQKKGLIPLCAIASMYDNVRQYHSAMYNDFCCLTIEEQNRVMECLELDLRVTPIDDIYQVCYDALLDIARNKIGDDTGLYDNGKYIHRALLHHSSKMLPKKHYKKINHITDVLSASYKHESKEPPINHLWTYYNAYTSDESSCCHVTNLIAGYIAIYWGINPEPQNKYYGDPGILQDDSKLETMEDLFLWALFHVYTYLVLPIQARELTKQQAISPRRTRLQKIKQKLKALEQLYILLFCILGIQKLCAGEIWTGVISLMLMILGGVITIILQLFCSGIKRESDTNAIQTFAIMGTMGALIGLSLSILIAY